MRLCLKKADFFCKVEPYLSVEEASMPNCAIICEYNPLHNGHLRLLNAVRELAGDGTVLCLMSGNFVQRGEPALLHRLDRAAAALVCGADLILELPLTTSIASAEAYAAGAVRVLRELGNVDYLCFGSECGDTARLMQTAEQLLSEEFRIQLRQQLDAKLPFAQARQVALEALSGDGSLLCSPNDILAVEYCKALRGTTLRPWTLRREGDYHGGAEPQQPSASWLRMHSQSWETRMPAAALALQRDALHYRYEYGERAVLARLRTLTDADWAALPYGGEGLWRRLMFAARETCNLNELLEKAATKRYPRARLRRMLLCAYLGITAEAMERPAPYVRLLGFRPQGQALLRGWRKAELPILHTGEPGMTSDYWTLESRADILYELCAQHLAPRRRERVVRWQD